MCCKLHLVHVRQYMTLCEVHDRLPLIEKVSPVDVLVM